MSRGIEWDKTQACPLRGERTTAWAKYAYHERRWMQNSRTKSLRIFVSSTDSAAGMRMEQLKNANPVSQLPPPKVSWSYSVDHNNACETRANLSQVPGNEALQNSLITKKRRRDLVREGVSPSYPFRCTHVSFRCGELYHYHCERV